MDISPKFAKLGPLLIAALAFSVPSAYAQSGKCEYCTYVACNGELSGVCRVGSVSTKCTLGGASCPYSCTEYLFCSRASAADSTTADSSATSCVPKVTAKFVRQVAAQRAVAQEDSDDAKTQAELLNFGGAAVRIQPQVKGPVTFVSATHSSKDMLAASAILNVSDKTVVGVRLGWLIKTLNEPNEMKMGNWINLESQLASEEMANLPAQKIDTVPLWKVGTLVKIFIVEVRFQDGTFWQRAPQKTGADSLVSSNIRYSSFPRN